MDECWQLVGRERVSRPRAITGRRSPQSQGRTPPGRRAVGCQNLPGGIGRPGAISPWEQWVFSDRVHTKLVPALHADSSGVRGAAFLCPEIQR